MAKVTELKDENIHRIRKCFYDGNIWTKNELSQATGLSLASTTNVLQHLLHVEEIKQIGEAKSTGGRKSKQYIINPDYQHLGLINLIRDQQKYYFVLIIADLAKKEIFNHTIVSKTGSQEELLGAIDYLLIKDKTIQALSISIPGISNDGVIDVCDFERLEHFDLQNEVTNRYHLPLMIENDVNVAGIGFSRSYPECNYLAFMYQPKVKYVGCSMIINHQLCKGYSNLAGELRYLPFLTHHQQDQMLQKQPEELLKQQLITLCCVVNPAIIGIKSDVIESFKSEELEQYLLKKHLPKIVFIEDLNQLINQGLIDLAINLVLDNLKKGEQ